MAKLKTYQETIAEVMREYIAYYKIPDSNLGYQCITDTDHQHYQLLRLGWYKRKRVHLLIFHIDVINGKLWIQLDNTEEGVANLLLKKGIAKSDIVLAYFSPNHRKLTEFAVA